MNLHYIIFGTLIKYVIVLSLRSTINIVLVTVLHINQSIVLCNMKNLYQGKAFLT